MEFALIALPFIVLLMAMLQTALLFFAGQVLQSATAQTGRLVMTGQARAMSTAQFQQALCDRASVLFDCTKLSVNVQTFPSFSAITRPSPLKSGKLDTSGFGYTPGSAGDIVIVQVFYPWPVGPSMPGLNLANINGDSALLTATSVFRNEPY